MPLTEYPTPRKRMMERDATTTSMLRVAAVREGRMRTMRTLRIGCVLMLLVAASGITTSWAQTPPQCLGKTATLVAQSDEPHDIVGTQGNDVIVAGPRDDRIEGRGGNDTICGAGGSDVITPGLGDDDIDGGTHQAGGDFVSYFVAPEGANGKGVTVDLEGLGGFNATGEGDDTLVNVENVAGSPFADTIRGNSTDNLLLGAGGDDVIFGRDGTDDMQGEGGDDVLSPGNGTDKVNGNDGSDTVSFRGALDSVVVNLAQRTATGGWGAETLDSIENVAGSNYPDSISGDHEINLLFGYKGDDTLFGSGGDPDTASASDADVLQGGADNDLMYGGNGIDVLDGGPNTKAGDTVSYEDAYGEVVANLTTNRAEPDGWGSSDTFEGVENLIGSYGEVTFTGDNGPNKIVGCNHHDVIKGLGGDDVIYGGLENDVIDGGDGNDRILGQDGDDVISGGPDNDTLSGGLHNDTLIGNAGKDDANGSKGTDRCDAESTRNCEEGPGANRSGPSAALKPI